MPEPYTIELSEFEKDTLVFALTGILLRKQDQRADIRGQKALFARIEELESMK